MDILFHRRKEQGTSQCKQWYRLSSFVGMFCYDDYSLLGGYIFWMKRAFVNGRSKDIVFQQKSYKRHLLVSTYLNYKNNGIWFRMYQRDSRAGINLLFLNYFDHFKKILLAAKQTLFATTYKFSQRHWYIRFCVLCTSKLEHQKIFTLKCLLKGALH